MAGTARRRRRSRASDRQRLEAAIDFYLEACYGSRTAARADEFAQFLRTARPHLSRLAVQLTGMKLRDILRARQLDHAKKLLRTTRYSVDEIALASAFGTSWTFYRCFRAAFGMSPTEYRQQEGD